MLWIGLHHYFHNGNLMTDPEILSLVKEHFVEQNPFCGFTSKEYAGGPDAFLKFVRAIYEKGEWDGKIKGYYDATGGRAND